MEENISGEEAQTSETKAEKLRAYLDKPHLARLATVNPATLMPHVVPVWFGWDGTSLWISAFSSTKKIKNLLKNLNCAVVIDTTENGAHGVMMEGRAELIVEEREVVYQKSTWIYTRYLGEEGVLEKEPQSWIYDAENMIIKLTPEKISLW